MKKEPIIAILLGIFFGVILALLVLNFTSDQTKETNKKPEQSESITSLLTPNIDEELFALVSPKDSQEISSSSAILVLNMKKNALIIVQGTSSEILQLAPQAGKLELTVPLKEGLNQLQITAIHKQQTSSQLLKIFSK